MFYQYSLVKKMPQNKNILQNLFVPSFKIILNFLVPRLQPWKIN